MLVGDVVELSKIQLQNLLVGRDDNAIIKFIHLGITDLYRRFNLSIKSETVLTQQNQAVYDLKNNDVSLILGVYNELGEELKQSDTTESLQWDYKIVNYRTFILNHRFDGVLYALYKATPIIIKDAKDHIDLPEDMIHALLFYVCYMVCSTIHSIASTAGRQSAYDCMDYFKLYTNACSELEMQGYKVPLNSETMAIYAKGFV